MQIQQILISNFYNKNINKTEQTEAQKTSISQKSAQNIMNAYSFLALRNRADLNLSFCAANDQLKKEMQTSLKEDRKKDKPLIKKCRL